MDYTIKDSGERREFDTGAVRDVSGGKGRFDLLPFLALWDLAKHYEKGCGKYGPENWLKGIPLRVMFDSAMRHSTEFFLGLEDGENHLIAAIWNLMGLYELKKRIEFGLLPSELDDIPYILRKKE
uniref:dATP/dGTP diphosphohydrolase N-terminal domain-containing protein n=1 Tax=viral metagenome TaxID=1070528 RepID=A0A6H1ZPN0_9ZZZZ